MERRKSKLQALKRTQERIEKDIFFGFCDFMNFFWDFWIYFCSMLLEKQILFRSQFLIHNIVRIRY